MLTRTMLAALVLAAAGCSKMADTATTDPQATAATSTAFASQVSTTSGDAALGQSPAGQGASPGNASRGQASLRQASIGQSFASLPDHGDLVAYPGKVVRHEGAYTWYRTDVSEAHALHAIAAGHLRMTTPAGEILDFKYDRHIEHPSGDWTWIGHLPGQVGEQAILTFGKQAMFGSIAQPGKRALRLTVRDGANWLVQTDAAKLAAINGAGTSAQGSDYHIVPRSALRMQSGPKSNAGGTTAVSRGQTVLAAAAFAAPTVDLLIGYTKGYSTALGGESAVQTRLNNLVDVTNNAYQNGEINAQLRLVKAMQVDYTDTNSNDVALKELTGYDADSNQQVPVNPAFDALRAAREEYGADVVSLVRDFNTPENGGCGIAWLLGGGLTGVAGVADSDDFAYSVVSDGDDTNEGDSKNYYCLDETLAHEVGHNMGASHDTEASKGEDGTLDNPDDYGAFTYSFGYKTAASAGNFYTVMAYGDSGQKIWGTFSNPKTTFCGGYACGTATEDNARTLRQTIPTVAAFRASLVPTPMATRDDFNADGVSDVLWVNTSSGLNTIWKSANKSSQQAVTTIRNLDWQQAGIGDFDGDGKSDILWHNAGTGGSIIWRSGNSAMPQYVASVSGAVWIVAGVGDFNGDGRADIFWRNTSSGFNAIWFSANRGTSFVMKSVTNQDWFAAGIGDFNGDGESDVLWRNAVTGANIVWQSARSQTTMSVRAVTNIAWHVETVADFDGDGRDDVFWRHHQTGSNTIWKSANSSTQQAVAAVTDTLWDVAASGDYNGDGKADVLWRNRATGVNTIWRSAVRTQQQTVASVGPFDHWQVGN